MKMIESCPRCGNKADRTMESMLEPGQQLCLPCAEEEMLFPGKAKRKIKRDITVPLWFSEEYKGEDPPERELSQPQCLYLPIHLGHAVKTSMAICCYQRFKADRITSNPNKVTCLRCLKHIRKQHGRNTEHV